MRPSNAPGPGEAIPMRVIAHIHNDFPTKFGIPRQSGLADTLLSQIIFTPPYRRPEALRGLSDFSHLWLLWQFSEAVRADWSPTVRPPRLGGNRRMGVFATRSPFRPNPIGLSAVRLLQVSEVTPAGPVLTVAGADLMDGTPILDIKPYLAYADAIPDAAGGFAEAVPRTPLAVDFPPALLEKIARALPASHLRMRLLLPYAAAGLAAEIREEGTVFWEEYTADGLRLDANVPLRLRRRASAFPDALPPA